MSRAVCDELCTAAPEAPEETSYIALPNFLETAPFSQYLGPSLR